MRSPRETGRGICIIVVVQNTNRNKSIAYEGQVDERMPGAGIQRGYTVSMGVHQDGDPDENWG